MVRSYFLVALQIVDCKPPAPVKKEFVEISRRVAFRNITMHVIQFSTELQNPEMSQVTSLKFVSNRDNLSAILEILWTLTRKSAVELFFSIVCRRLDNSNTLKRSLLKSFVWEISETFETAVFLNIPEKCMEWSF